ncbi:MAG: hypothetical protein LBE02_08720 [Spirochaetaceae bacterium]|jgi:hypothetical protein|nr:hypothetical protein [Spirochaetaceae bacterium]
MNFEHFALSRDLFYLTALSLGAGLGALLMAYRKTGSRKQHGAWISTTLFLGSLIVSALAAAVILSKGLVFTVPSLYPWGCLFLLLGILGIRFFKIGGCAIIFAGGLFVVWICISFLNYAPFTEPEQLSLEAASSGQIVIRRDPAGRRAPEAWTVEDDGRTLFIEAAAVTAHGSYPLIGGERRGAIIRIRREDRQLAAINPDGFRFKHSGGLGFSLDQYTLELPPGILASGINLAVLFNGRALYFDPPIQL